jgi:hypothetical protein
MFGIRKMLNRRKEAHQIANARIEEHNILLRQAKHSTMSDKVQSKMRNLEFKRALENLKAKKDDL